MMYNNIFSEFTPNGGARLWESRFDSIWIELSGEQHQFQMMWGKAVGPNLREIALFGIILTWGEVWIEWISCECDWDGAWAWWRVYSWHTKF